MQKIMSSISITAAIVLTGLAGCGINGQVQNDNKTNLEQAPLFANEKNANQNSDAFTNVNDRGFNDQHMFDQIDAMNVGHNWGDENGAYSRQSNYGYNDYNYHGQLNTTYNGQPTRSYHTGHENVIAQKVTDRIEHKMNVRDVAAFIDGDTILVAIDTEDDHNPTIEAEVRQIVEGMANGRKVEVVTDKAMFNRVNNMMKND